MIWTYKSKDISYFMEKFPEVKNMILSSEYVSSCNFSMNFFPVVLNADNEIGMSMRVPLSAYFCVHKTATPWVSFDKSIFYDTYTDNINIYGWTKYGDKLDKLAEYVADYLKSYDIEPHLSINIFMPRDRNIWFWYKSFWSVMLSYWLLVETWQITDYENWNPAHQEKIMKIVKDIYSLVSSQNFKRGTFLWPLRHKHAHPVYFNHEQMVNLYDHKAAELPVDIAILNFGSWYERNISLKSIDDFHKTMAAYIAKLDWTYKEDYLNKFAYCLKAEFINNYEMLISNTTSESYMQKFMTTIEHINNYARIVEWPNEMIDKINAIIKGHKQFESEHIWVLPMTSNQHSDNVMIIANKNKSRKTLANIIEKINDQYKCALEYISRIDSDYKNWIHVDHRHKKHISMPQHAQYDAVIRKLDGSSVYALYTHVMSDYKDHLVIDSIANKIYMWGKSIDSTLLPSQTYTISFMKKLIDNINQWVPNSSLETSAYSKSMNQLSGKILSPLKKLTSDLLGSPIDIQVTGTLYTYDIKLQSSQDKIIFIEKKAP